MLVQTHFPLVRVASDNSIEAWRTPVDGASAFALDGSKIIFYGGYADERDRLTGFDLRRHVIQDGRATVTEDEVPELYGTRDIAD